MTDKRAWVTLATNDSYAIGALVLANSLKLSSTINELAVLITPGVSPAMKEELSKVFNTVKEVDVLDSKDAANLALLARPELGVTFTKLHCWNLTQYSKCVFLDADTLVVQNSDELFDRDELSAAPDAGWPDCFNSGVFVFKPNSDTFKAILDYALSNGSFDGGDQGLLNTFFGDWSTKDIKKHLPFVYNMVSTATYSYLPAYKFYGDKIKIVHFIGANKPWLQCEPTSTTLTSYLELWWNIFNGSVSKQLSNKMINNCSVFGDGPKASQNSTPTPSPEPERHTFTDPWEHIDNQKILKTDQRENKKILNGNSGLRNTYSPPPRGVKKLKPLDVKNNRINYDKKSSIFQTKNTKRENFVEIINDIIPPNNTISYPLIENVNIQEEIEHIPKKSVESGLAGALAGGKKVEIEEQWRKQDWEHGNIDYTGKDSFENIWKKISQTVGLHTSAVPPVALPEIPKVEPTETKKSEVLPEPPKTYALATEGIKAAPSPIQATKPEVPATPETPKTEVPAAPGTPVPAVPETPKTEAIPAVPEAAPGTPKTEVPAVPETPKPEAVPESAPKTEVPSPVTPKTETATETPKIETAPGTPKTEAALLPVVASEALKTESAPAAPEKIETAPGAAPETQKIEAVPVVAAEAAPTAELEKPKAETAPPAPEALKTEAAPVAAPKAETPTVPEAPKTEKTPVPETPKTEIAPSTPTKEVAPLPVVAPEIPKTEAVPLQVAPETPKTEAVPDTPKTEVPVPDAPKTETAPSTPKTEAAPGTPKTETAPGTPQTEAAPGTPKTEAAPSTPKTEVAPSTPKTEAAPGTPKTEVAPSMPTTEAPVPPTTEKPKIEAAPRTPKKGSPKKGSAPSTPVTESPVAPELPPKPEVAPKPDAPAVPEKPKIEAAPETPKTDVPEAPKLASEKTDSPAVPETPKTEASQKTEVPAPKSADAVKAEAGKEQPKTDKADKKTEQAKKQKTDVPSESAAAPTEPAPGTPTVTSPSMPGSPLSVLPPEDAKLQVAPSDPQTPPAGATGSVEAPVPPKRKGNQKGGNGKQKNKK